tara:strand:+ start:536 stop:751 length:216 start_codon:yes stop_codon:yes gene_type:complete
MANNINWGAVYCQMITDGGFGSDTAYSTMAIPDISAPACWGTFPLTVDLTNISGTPFTSDTTTYRTDQTQL